MSLLALILATTAALLPAAATTPQRPQMPLLRHLDLDMTIAPAAGTLTAGASLMLTQVGPGSLDRVPLLLNRLLTVDSVKVDGKATGWRQSIERFTDFDVWQVRSLEVELDRAIPDGGRVTVSIWYHGRVAPYTETGMRYVHDHVAPGFTLVRADALTFPVVGTLSIADNRAAPRADFTFDARLTVPSDLTGANGATLVERKPHGTTVTWHHRSTTGVPFLLLAAGHYVELTDGAITVFAFPEDSTGGRALLTAAAAASELLEARFGPPAAGARIAVIEIPEGWGSQASATGGIIQTADAFRERSERSQLHHELSHLWNARDIDLPSARWNEGLATWLQYRIAGALDPAFDADAALQRRYGRLREQAAADSSWRATPLARHGAAGMTDRSYTLGAVAFDLLAGALGEPEFDRRYRSYLQSHWGEGATLAGLTAALTDGAPPTARAVVREWIEETTWVDLIGTEPSLAAMRARYR